MGRQNRLINIVWMVSPWRKLSWSTFPFIIFIVKGTFMLIAIALMTRPRNLANNIIWPGSQKCMELKWVYLQTERAFCFLAIGRLLSTVFKSKRRPKAPLMVWKPLNSACLRFGDIRLDHLINVILAGQSSLRVVGPLISNVVRQHANTDKRNIKC